MKRHQSLLLVSLLVLAGMAAGRPAAADPGGSVYIIGVFSRPGATSLREAIAYGQQQTVLDHSGTYLSVDVWIPTGAYTDDLRVSFRGLRMASPTSVRVYENGRCIGQIVTYVLGWNWDPEGACVVDVVAGWGTRRVLHNLWIR